MSNGELVLYASEDGSATFFLRAQDGTVWLTQMELAELFQTSIPNVNIHIKNVLEEGELQPEATIKEDLIVRLEGKRQVKRPVKLYNLDMILAVGYRVKSPRGTQFRQWATTHLREYLVKGFVMDDERMKDPVGWDYFDELLQRIRRRGYLAGHLPGAVHVPRGHLESRIEATVPDRSQRVVLYCAGFIGSGLQLGDVPVGYPVEHIRMTATGAGGGARRIQQHGVVFQTFARSAFHIDPLAHGDHLGDMKLTAIGAGTCDNVPVVSAAPNSTTAEIAAAKNAAVVMVSPLAAFVGRKIDTIRGKPTAACPVTGADVIAPLAAPCLAPAQTGGTRTVKANATAKAVEIIIVPAAHDSTVPIALLGEAAREAIYLQADICRADLLVVAPFVLPFAKPVWLTLHAARRDRKRRREVRFRFGEAPGGPRRHRLAVGIHDRGAIARDHAADRDRKSVV